MMNNIVYLDEGDHHEDEPHQYTGDKNYDLILTDSIFAVGLTRRNIRENDHHVIYHILAEDDGHIFETVNLTNQYSIYWLKHHANFLKKVQEYIETHLDMFTLDENGYGWSFKNTS